MEIKDFFNWSQFRLIAYTFSALYLGVIRLFSFIFPHLRNLIQRYQSGETGRPVLIISLISSILFESILISCYIFIFDGFNRDKNVAIIILAYYPAFVLAGWLSLISMAGYERKESK